MQPAPRNRVRLAFAAHRGRGIQTPGFFFFPRSNRVLIAFPGNPAAVWPGSGVCPARRGRTGAKRRKFCEPCEKRPKTGGLDSRTGAGVSFPNRGESRAEKSARRGARSTDGAELYLPAVKGETAKHTAASISENTYIFTGRKWVKNRHLQNVEDATGGASRCRTARWNGYTPTIAISHK